MTTLRVGRVAALLVATYGVANPVTTWCYTDDSAIKSRVRAALFSQKPPLPGWHRDTSFLWERQAGIFTLEGPHGAGKSTVALNLAQAPGGLYVRIDPNKSVPLMLLQSIDMKPWRLTKFLTLGHDIEISEEQFSRLLPVLAKEHAITIFFDDLQTAQHCTGFTEAVKQLSDQAMFQAAPLSIVLVCSPGSLDFIKRRGSLWSRLKRQWLSDLTQAEISSFLGISNEVAALVLARISGRMRLVCQLQGIPTSQFLTRLEDCEALERKLVNGVLEGIGNANDVQKVFEAIHNNRRTVRTMSGLGTATVAMAAELEKANIIYRDLDEKYTIDSNVVQNFSG
eukprot:TRINITY_DN53875_c0_g1_i1.p1 TRINITY_DN53875_c0_g1~~TRINITY_DN53875_c0_g1_i1.p1  ORF type:complete len:339 (+),score=42.70 TRINITY_DN53875_c0_g1_i1:25-1041(+)